MDSLYNPLPSPSPHLTLPFSSSLPLLSLSCLPSSQYRHPLLAAIWLYHLSTAILAGELPISCCANKETYRRSWGEVSREYKRCEKSDLADRVQETASLCILHLLRVCRLEVQSQFQVRQMTHLQMMIYSLGPVKNSPLKVKDFHEKQSSSTQRLPAPQKVTQPPLALAPSPLKQGR